MSHFFEAPKYIVNGDMSLATVTGGAIKVGPRRTVVATIGWTAAGTQIGTLSLLFLRADGTTLREVPGSSAEFTANGNSQPNNDTKTITCHWREVAYDDVFIRYTRSSGGTANTSLQAEVFAD